MFFFFFYSNSLSSFLTTLGHCSMSVPKFFFDSQRLYLSVVLLKLTYFIFHLSSKVTLCQTLAQRRFVAHSTISYPKIDIKKIYDLLKQITGRTINSSACEYVHLVSINQSALRYLFFFIIKLQIVVGESTDARIAPNIHGCFYHIDDSVDGQNDAQHSYRNAHARHE